jgi:rhodanese-related sulfurtransferase
VTVRWRRWLAGGAALAGALAPLAGSPYRRSGPASVDVTALAQEVSDQEDHVPALELARWIRAARPGLRVIDLRSASEFRAFHLPGAEHIPLDRLVQTRFGPDQTVVLYSEVGVHGAQAWVMLRALGHSRVYFLRDGLHEWLDDVMSPAIDAGAPPEALAAFATTAELSRWFGGTPRWIRTAAPAALERAARRRGC